MIPRKYILTIIAGTVAQMMSLPAIAYDDIVGVASVVDGDTIKIHGTNVRLHAIDSPEPRQPCVKNGKQWRCGKDASFALADKIGRKTVRCEILDIDYFKRPVGRCFLGSTDLNAWLVSQGWAVAYRQYGKDYVPQEAQAKAALRGIWSSNFQMPWDWRRSQRSR